MAREAKIYFHDQFALNLGFSKIVRDNVYKDFFKQSKQVHNWIERSFLTDECKERYTKIFDEKMKHIFAGG